MVVEREGRAPGPSPGKGPGRDPWSKAEIIAVVIGTVASIIVVPLVIWLVTTLTELQVQVGVINTRLDSIDKTLVSMDGRMKQLEAWQLDHLKGHAARQARQMEDYDTTTGE